MWFSPRLGANCVVCMTIDFTRFEGVELVGNAAGRPNRRIVTTENRSRGSVSKNHFVFTARRLRCWRWSITELTPMDKVPAGILHAGIQGPDTLMTLVIFFTPRFLPLTRPFTPVRVCCGLWRAINTRQPAGKTNGGGVPVYAILITALLALR